MFGNKYKLGKKGSSTTKKWPRRIVILFVVFLALVFVGVVGVRYYYNTNLKSVSESQKTQLVTVVPGATVDDISKLLEEKNLIRNATVFKWYIASTHARDSIQAGTYELRPNLSVQEIVSILTHGKTATDLVTIFPGRRIDQVRQDLIDKGFSEERVDAALQPEQYESHPALVDKPKGASLEGYLYPESFQKTKATEPEVIIRASLELMGEHLTPDIRAAFAARGLSVYQGLVLASVVEQEAFQQSDRDQIAQVFLKRLGAGMKLESDPTSKYGAIQAGSDALLTYDSPYNTYIYAGLPPTPISNVSESSLNAVASPASTDWLFFVSGDDGTVYFSKTLEEHENYTKLYCTTLCGN